MDVERFLDDLDTLKLADLRRVRARADELIAHIEATQDPDYGRVEPTYRQEYVRCGKERCKKCADGPGHGPYWYAYWSKGGRTHKQYIGKTRPDG